MCHPSATPGGCGHGVGVVLAQEDREARKVRKGYSNNYLNTFSHTVPSLYRASTGHQQTSRNPSYTPTSISTTTPSVQYSSLGPRDGTSNPSPSTATYDVVEMNPGPSRPQGAEERVYHVLEGPQEQGGEREREEEGAYYLLGETRGGEGLAYEAPISIIPSQQSTPHCNTSEADWSARGDEL